MTVTTKPRLRYVHHVSFRVDDLDQSVSFYRDVLGCTQIPRPDLKFRGAWLQLDDTQIHLLEVAADETTGTPPNCANPKANHIAFSVEDFDGFRAYLSESGVRTVDGVPGIRQFLAQDPSGNVLEFTPATR